MWECEIKVLNALSEAGAGSGGSAEEVGEDMLKDMVGEIRSVIREYRDHKEKVGKKSTSGGNASKSKVKARKRKATEDEEEDEGASSDSDAQSCTE